MTDHTKLACICALALSALLGSGATSAAADEACPNQALRAEQHSTYLPDCRAYELVSPQDKNGGEVALDSTRTRASVSGDAVEFPSSTAFADPHGTGIASEYVSQREGATGTQGWSTHAISPNQKPLAGEEVISGTFDPRYLGELSSDLNKGVFLAKSNIGAGGDNVARVYKLYRRDDLLSKGEGHYTLLSDCPDLVCPEPLVSSDPQFQPALAGASADFGHVIFESTLNLTAGAGGELPKLYEWDQGTLRLAGMVPPGGDSECGPAPLDPCQPASNSAAGQGADPVEIKKYYTRNTISTDGSRILFTSPVGPHSEGTSESQLYLRQDGATTVRLNASERTDCAADPSCGGDGIPDPDPVPTGPATFQAATPDLSKIYFVSGPALTDAKGGGLYVYDASKPASDPHNLQLVTSSVTGVIGVSDDGSYIYFVSESQLPGSTTACNSGQPCIFIWHDGALREVARININIEERTIIGTLPWSNSPMRARVTPDGTHLVFVSEGTSDESPPYDHGSCQGAAGMLPYFGTQPGCAEVYMYDATADAGAGRLTCVSCNPSGQQSSSTDADFTITLAIAGRSSHLNHPLSDDGRFIFFDTGEPLLPQDTNGETYDVYRYDSQTKAVSLISSGTSPDNSYFLDASPNGHDVFFTTTEHLSGWDRDRQADLYDARIGGGFAEPLASVQCLGDSCQGSQTAAPPTTTPGSGSLVIGTPRPHCPRGRVLRHGHCVKKSHHKKHRRHRAGHNRRAAQ